MTFVRIKYARKWQCLLMIFAFLCSMVAPAASDTNAEKASYPYQIEIQQLADHADLVVYGRVYKIEQFQRESKVVFQPETVYKGALESPWIEVRTGSGKIFQDGQSPVFGLQERCFLFLARHQDGYYECVNGAVSKKLVVHDNVYINPASSLGTVTLDNYRKALAQLQKAVV